MSNLRCYLLKRRLWFRPRVLKGAGASWPRPRAPAFGLDNGELRTDLYDRVVSMRLGCPTNTLLVTTQSRSVLDDGEHNATLDRSGREETRGWILMKTDMRAYIPSTRFYLYLLRDRTIDQPNQVWASDITYIPLRRGFFYLVAIIDWSTRRVLSWRLSNNLTVEFCVEALGEALARFGKPGIFNTDQGSQFTSEAFTRVLLDHRIEISMHGRGRCHDNIFVERLWWTVKHEWVYLRPAANGLEQRHSLGEFCEWYNHRRPDQALGWQTPDKAYS